MKATALEGLRVCHVTSGHPPLDDRIFYKEARTLAKAGAEVTILHSDVFESPPTRDGVRFISYSGGGPLHRRLRSVPALRDALATGQFDVMHCHEPDAALASLRARSSARGKVIYDSHEMWAAVAAGRLPAASWRLAERVLRVPEDSILKRCDAAIGASWAISERLQAAMPHASVVTLLNVPVVDVFGEGDEKDWSGPLMFCHDGTLSFDRGLREMLEAVREVAALRPLRFRIVGDVFGPERAWLEAFIREHRLETVVERTGWLPYEQVGAALAPCHVGLVCLQQTPNNIPTSANKEFNYLRYGMPVIAPDFRRSMRRIIGMHACGLLGDSASPKSYAEAMLRMIDDRSETRAMADRAAAASKAYYRWSHMEVPLIELYQSLLGGQSDKTPAMCAGAA